VLLELGTAEDESLELELVVELGENVDELSELLLLWAAEELV
jgi:hypothetical protein